ncbi:glutathione-dependent formaldehyde-activating GFA [Penicillium canescens]|uniref:Glutathione-dependent formaldehyde-activating GFA n=1 Tax=Penicillium canescens TaxID=5083 RepID=A0AAD6I5Z0_PENCN|nr:glutathione-dependent formaldehyde-activating GFA [Penicillium canescens]KAJ6030921.1 glutathione-dependent formaldehyde-activating GFA [Penicillium canescens]KAJ6059359.1 glutathione-dependent formaldehyde-activating GFA [Penicillium canescens]KAJ6077077.1 glutathione-dependent formaldehyde-activating GFA [Penicillium canescens]
MYWRCPNEDGDEIEMAVGTVDEEWLRKYGRELCEPERGQFYAENEVYGVGFGGEFKQGLGGPRSKEGSRSERLD